MTAMASASNLCSADVDVPKKVSSVKAVPLLDVYSTKPVSLESNLVYDVPSSRASNQLIPLCEEITIPQLKTETLPPIKVIRHQKPYGPQLHRLSVDNEQCFHVQSLSSSSKPSFHRASSSQSRSPQTQVPFSSFPKYSPSFIPQFPTICENVSTSKIDFLTQPRNISQPVNNSSHLLSMMRSNGVSEVVPTQSMCAMPLCYDPTIATESQLLIPPTIHHLNKPVKCATKTGLEQHGFTQVFGSDGSFLGIRIDCQLMMDIPSFSNLGGGFMQCCTIYVSQFWDYIRVPNMTCRNVDRKHIERLKFQILETPQISVGTISVTPKYDKHSCIYFEVVDGVHRFCAILELRGEGKIDHLTMIRVVVYSPQMSKNHSLWMELNDLQRLSCAADLNRLGALQRKMTVQDKYHTVQSFVVCEMKTDKKEKLFGAMSRVIRHAISLNLLKRLGDDDSINESEYHGEVAKEVFQKLSVSYREFFRAAIGFIDCPIASRLALTDASPITGMSTQPPFWTKRTFSITSFAEANDTSKVVLLYMIEMKNSRGNRVKKEQVGKFFRFATTMLKMLPRDEKKLLLMLLHPVKTRGINPSTCLLVHVIGAFAEIWIAEEREKILHLDECIKEGRVLKSNCSLPHLLDLFLHNILPLPSDIAQELNVQGSIDWLEKVLLPTLSQPAPSSKEILGEFLDCDAFGRFSVVVSSIGVGGGPADVQNILGCERSVLGSFEKVSSSGGNNIDNNKDCRLRKSARKASHVASVSLKQSVTKSDGKRKLKERKRRCDRKSGHTKKNNDRTNGIRKKQKTRNEKSDHSDNEYNDLCWYVDTDNYEKLPKCTEMPAFPKLCHADGLWRRFLQNEDVEEMKKDLQQAMHSRMNVILPQMPSYYNASLSYSTAVQVLRDRLFNNGHVILDGFFEASVAKSWIEELFAEYESTFCGEGGIGKNDERSAWESVLNFDEEEDGKLAAEGIGRFYVNMADEINHLLKNNQELLLLKLKLELYTGIVLHDLVDDGNTQDPLQYPLLGSKILLNTKTSRRQCPHVDFNNDINNDPDGSMWTATNKCSYFCMISGANGFPIWIWNQAHHYWNAPSRIAEEIFKTMSPSLVSVPPWSLLLVRGDVPHAGAGGMDNPAVEMNSPHARLHLYLTRKKSAVFGDRVGDERVDSIHRLPPHLFTLSGYDDRSGTEHSDTGELETGVCYRGSSCTFEGNASHKCTTCHTKWVHNLCDYGKVVMKDFSREGVYVCSQKCLDNEKTC